MNKLWCCAKFIFAFDGPWLYFRVCEPQDIKCRFSQSVTVKRTPQACPTCRLRWWPWAPSTRRCPSALRLNCPASLEALQSLRWAEGRAEQGRLNCSSLSLSQLFKVKPEVSMKEQKIICVQDLLFTSISEISFTKDLKSLACILTGFLAQKFFCYIVKKLDFFFNLKGCKLAIMLRRITMIVCCA